MTRSELALFAGRLQTLGQEVRTDYEGYGGGRSGYRLFIHVGEGPAVVLKTAREAEMFVTKLARRKEAQA